MGAALHLLSQHSAPGRDGQVSEDKRSGIRSDPNRADDEEYIERLVGQVVKVSLEMVRIVSGLPGRPTPINFVGHCSAPSSWAQGWVSPGGYGAYA
jgi:hypothetical protein